MFLVVVSYIKRRRSVRILSTTSARSTSSGGAKGRSFLTNHRPILYNRSWLMLFWLGEQYWSIYKVSILEFRPTWNLLGLILMTEVNKAKKWKFKYSPHKLAIRISKKLGGTEQSRPKPRYRNGPKEENIVQNRERIAHAETTDFLNNAICPDKMSHSDQSKTAGNEGQIWH